MKLRIDVRSQWRRRREVIRHIAAPENALGLIPIHFNCIDQTFLDKNQKMSVTDQSVGNECSNTPFSLDQVPMPQSTTPKDKACVPAKRRRLAPQVRSAQILNAALTEFSKRGFSATTMDDIARSCELSKSGLYAHFASKDAIFEALLHRCLAPPEWQATPPPPPDAPTQAFAQWLVDCMHAGLLQRPETVEILRLLAAERGRVEPQLQLWEQSVLQPTLALLGNMLRTRAVHQGLCTSIVVHEPWLVLAPVMHALLTQMVLGREPTVGLKSLRDCHVQLLCELLEPRVGPCTA